MSAVHVEAHSAQAEVVRRLVDRLEELTARVEELERRQSLDRGSHLRDLERFMREGKA